jgi:nitrate/TMAO reductase-like tetraheme cytochrome c subunit
LWKRPRRWFWFGIPLGGLLAFVVGVGVAGGFVGSLKFTETTAFCTSCHEMEQPLRELQQSVHHSNIYGIQASCADCHVPPQLIPGLIRHAKASVEVWGHLTGKLSTPAKYESQRAELAKKVWAELKANDSAECRSCHNQAAMNLEKQDPIAAKRHSPEYMAKAGKTCIDCHKGVAHTLPGDS